jgi:molecular chaperone IbpA
MRTNPDLSAVYRASVGFDRLFTQLEKVAREDLGNWPPYDIVKTGPDDYAITLAVPGFAGDELQIVNEDNVLVVTGGKADGGSEILHRGINGGPFTRRFELADFMQVLGASLDHGLLTIELRRELPEAMKPRRIEITLREAAAGAFGTDDVVGYLGLSINDEDLEPARLPAPSDDALRDGAVRDAAALASRQEELDDPQHG